MPEASWRLGAPSFVIAGTVAENCVYLQGRVDEIGLCLFESKACLDYDENDLPLWLADIQGRKQPMRYHVHLPLDLPWTQQDQGAEAACSICVALARKTAFLEPEVFVLHPPRDNRQLETFLAGWQEAGFEVGALCLENTRDNDLAQNLRLAYAAECGVCLDYGHVLAYGQHWLLQAPEVLQRIRLLHLYAPVQEAGGRHRHRPLTQLSGGQLQQLDELLQFLSPGKGRALLLELFHWPDWAASAEVAARWL